MRSEVDELEEEIHATTPGEDGIVGEAIDVIACALDIILVTHPDISEDDLNTLMTRKCEKWARKYS